MASSRGFIAAPLIGTMIFLACVMWMVNISNTENNGVGEIVSNAYHNRVVSLLEVYRMDLASIFRAGLSSNVERFLAQPGWNAFSVGNGVDVSEFNDRDGDGLWTSYSEARYDRCDDLQAFMKQVICLQGDGTGGAGSLQQYGLAAWFNVIAENVSFEGITYSLANANSLTTFDPLDPTKQSREVQLFCQKMIEGTNFDCGTFGRSRNYEMRGARPLQCCDKRVGYGQTCASVGGNVVPGCEDGTFYVEVVIKSDPEVFRQMPRILADDGEGNQVRSGALADEDFLVHVRYPFFDYYDRAFNFAEYASYGFRTGVDTPAQGTTNDRNREGIIEGHCGETGTGTPGTKCSSVPITELGPYSHYYDLSMRLPEAGLAEPVQRATANRFVDGVLVDACMKSALAGNNPANSFSLHMKDGGSSIECSASQSAELKDFAVRSSLVLPTACPVGPSELCGIVKDSSGLVASLRDARPSYKVLEGQDNRFDFNVKIKHDSSIT